MSGTRIEKIECSNDGNVFICIYGDQQKVDLALQLLHDLLDQKELTVIGRYVNGRPVIGHTSQVRVEIIIPGPKAEFITDGGEIIKKLQVCTPF